MSWVNKSMKSIIVWTCLKKHTLIMPERVLFRFFSPSLSPSPLRRSNILVRKSCRALIWLCKSTNKTSLFMTFDECWHIFCIHSRYRRREQVRISRPSCYCSVILEITQTMIFVVYLYQMRISHTKCMKKRCRKTLFVYILEISWLKIIWKFSMAFSIGLRSMSHS